MNRKHLRTAAITACMAAAIVGTGIAGFAIGDSRAYSSQTGYNLPGFSQCNFGAGNWGRTVNPKSERVTVYGNKHMFAADLSCTNGEIDAYNSIARESGSPDRVCRFDADVVVGIVVAFEPQSCASVAQNDSANVKR